MLMLRRVLFLPNIVHCFLLSPLFVDARDLMVDLSFPRASYISDTFTTGFSKWTRALRANPV